MKGFQMQTVTRILQWILNFGLIILAFILIIFLSREIVILSMTLISSESQHTSSYSLLEGIVIYFLYFEFIALIMKYFQSGCHFPLRYFIYIGITAIVRFIIVYHENPLDTLVYACAILTLLLALYLANTEKLKRV